MDEAFDALLELDERAVVGDGQDAAANLRTDRVALGCVEPRVRRELLEAERDALLLLVELQHLDLDLVAYVDEVAGWVSRPQLMSVMWSRPSRPPRSTNAP